jgi:hypothetical protein
VALVVWCVATRDGPVGGLAVGLTVSCGLVLLLATRGAPRRFAAGFTAGAVAALLLGCCFTLAPGGLLHDYYDSYLALAMNLVESALYGAGATEVETADGEVVIRTSVSVYLFTESVVALPVVVLALVCGLVACRPSRRVRPIHRAGAGRGP